MRWFAKEHEKRGTDPATSNKRPKDYGEPSQPRMIGRRKPRRADRRPPRERRVGGWVTCREEKGSLKEAGGPRPSIRSSRSSWVRRSRGQDRSEKMEIIYKHTGPSTNHQLWPSRRYPPPVDLFPLFRYERRFCDTFPTKPPPKSQNRLNNNAFRCYRYRRRRRLDLGQRPGPRHCLHRSE